MQYDKEKIKSISIIDYLAKRGLHPKRKSGKTAAYLSPLGEETKPSFMVDIPTNTWKDYHAGDTYKNDIINLVMRLDNKTFAEALADLGGDSFSEIPKYTPVKKADGVKIQSVGNIIDGELIDYACGVRKISEEVLHKFCVQISISFPFSKKDTEREYTLLGFKSDGGGYECRNSWMKICAGSKSHTTIKGKSKDKCIVTEGFFDVLSYFTYYNVLVPEYTMYCLNGAGQFPVLNKFIGKTPIKYYGDNDRQGDLIADEIESIIDLRYIYAYYNDFNSFLTNCEK